MVTTCDWVTTDVQADCVGLLPLTLTTEYDARLINMGKSKGSAVACRHSEAMQKKIAVGVRSILSVVWGG